MGREQGNAAALDADEETRTRRRPEDAEADEDRDAARARSRTLLQQQVPMLDAARGQERDDEGHFRPRPPLDLATLFESARQAAPAKQAKATKTARNKPDRDPGFEQVSRGGLREGHSPRKVVLPEAVDQGLDKAAKQAEAGDAYVEQGGNVVRNYDGTYGVRHAEEGTDDAFQAVLNDVGWSQELVGVMHTHPTDDGAPMTFSEADFTSLTGEGQPLNLLRSGEMTFMIARTREFDRLVATYEAAEKLDELDDKIWDCYDRVFERTKGTHVEKLEAAVLAVCKEFHLVYYKGEGRELNRVSPRPAAKEAEHQ